MEREGRCPGAALFHVSGKSAQDLRLFYEYACQGGRGLFASMDICFFREANPGRIVEMWYFQSRRRRFRHVKIVAENAA